MRGVDLASAGLRCVTLDLLKACDRQRPVVTADQAPVRRRLLVHE